MSYFSSPSASRKDQNLTARFLAREKGVNKNSLFKDIFTTPLAEGKGHPVYGTGSNSIMDVLWETEDEWGEEIKGEGGGNR